MERKQKEKRSKILSDKPESQNNLHGSKIEQDFEKSVENEKLKVQTTNMTSIEENQDTVDALKNQLETLMNSLAVLSAEKSRMESNFQTEKKQIRIEREEYEKVIKNLKEKLKRIQSHATSEVDHLKYKLIMERHEREKDQADYAAATKELQKLLSSEQKAREQIESQLKEIKNTTSNKSQVKILEVELDLLKKKLKQMEAAKNETPTISTNLQTEITVMKKKHKNAILEEQKRVASAEQKVRALAASHESRVAGLEARLAELSDIVGGYDRLRQQDQKAIQKLKEQLIILQNNDKDESENPEQLANKIKNLYFHLLELDKSNSPSNIKDILKSLKFCDKSQDLFYKEKYETLLQEFEEFKKCSFTNEVHPQVCDVLLKDETQLQKAKSHNKNLEEKLGMLLTEISEKEKNFKIKLEEQQQLLQEQYLKTDQLLAQKDSEYLNKIATIEQQLLRQRERSLSVIHEKDKEIQTLKSSFDALLPKKNLIFDANNKKFNLPLVSMANNPKSEANDLVSGLLVENNPPMLHYTQELARKEVQISGLRKQNVQLEVALRELERNAFRVAEKHDEEIKKLDNQIKRLEASKSREGANLEYLKNVFINFLTSNDSARKRHMLNAISTILQFTAEESEKISKQR